MQRCKIMLPTIVHLLLSCPKHTFLLSQHLSVLHCLRMKITFHFCMHKYILHCLRMKITFHFCMHKYIQNRYIIHIDVSTLTCSVKQLTISYNWCRPCKDNLQTYVVRFSLNPPDLFRLQYHCSEKKQI